MMKKTITAFLIFLMALTTLGAEKISGYVGVSTGYEFNIIEKTIDNADFNDPVKSKLNFQGVPFYLEGETYFCPWVGGYYGVGLYTIPTILEEGDQNYKPFGETAPVLYTTPYVGLALRYDFNDLLAIVFDTGISYVAWKLPPAEIGDENLSDFIHMLNMKFDIALGIHPMHNMGIRIGLKVDTPVYTGLQRAAGTGIRIGNASATVTGVKLVPYIGMGYAYGR